MVKVIRAEYDGLREVARVFAHHADLSVALTFQIEGLVDQLQGGAWRGVGAEAFYAEMSEVILPAMRKLQDALQGASEGTGKIHHILREAEEEAARLFQSLPEWDSLPEYAPPPTDDSPTDQKEEKEKLKKLLEAYGIILTGNWSLEELQHIYATVNKVGVRLEQFAAGIYGTYVPSGAELFKALFGKAGKQAFARGEGSETKEGAWAFNYRGEKITFYNKAFFKGQKNIARSLLSDKKQFMTSFGAAFLVLHELGHSLIINSPEVVNGNMSHSQAVLHRTLAEYFEDSLSPLQKMLKELTKSDKVLPEDIGSAGFYYAARSEVDSNELLADAIANWVLESYSDDAFGDARQTQMNNIMRRLFYSKFGFPTGMRSF